jgi:hypothetical protein
VISSRDDGPPNCAWCDRLAAECTRLQAGLNAAKADRDSWKQQTMIQAESLRLANLEVERLRRRGVIGDDVTGFYQQKAATEEKPTTS